MPSETDFLKERCSEEVRGRQGRRHKHLLDDVKGVGKK
jgi:hypothetical protein